MSLCNFKSLRINESNEKQISMDLKTFETSSNFKSMKVTTPTPPDPYFAVNVRPDSLHVIPVGDDSVFHRVSDAEQPSMVFGFWSHKQVAFQRASHDADMLRPSHARERSIKLMNEQLVCGEEESK